MKRLTLKEHMLMEAAQAEEAINILADAIKGTKYENKI